MPNAFFTPFFQYFAPVIKTYGFNLTSAKHNSGGFGSGMLRLSSERYFLDFSVDGMGPQVSMALGRHGQQATDVAWIFASLTRARLTTAPLSGSAPAPGLYYFPHLPLNIWGEESVAWQAARLADVLKPLWGGMLIFLDTEGQRAAEFAALRKRIERQAAERAADGYPVDPVVYQLGPGAAEPGAAGPGSEAVEGTFAQLAQKSFAFLSAYGFQCAYAAPRLVRFETSQGVGRLGGDAGVDPLYVTVFQRPQSAALEVHTGKIASTPDAEHNFEMQELAEWAGLRYTAEVVRRSEEMPAALNRLSRIYRQLAAQLLAGDTRLFVALLTRRIDAARRASRVWVDRNRGR